ncbi:MAG: PQQ-binding-like beta-propeller repeat protein [Candidatus Methanofastidiosia archaeon]|jgi:outer membrane protein assembly factor BamB
MNVLAKLFKVLVIVCLLYCSTFSYISPSLHEIDTQEITKVNITYSVDAHLNTPARRESYTIEKIGNTYCSNTGKEVNPHLIKSLLLSLTDLYESHEYENRYDGFFMTSYYPHFKIIITLDDQSQIILKSDSNYHCWIPWNVYYKEKTYVQYNGKIPSALLKILAVLNKKWLRESNLVQYGCYPAPPPDRYTEKGVSPNSPVYIPVEPPEELVGLPHLQWKTNTQTLMVVSPLFVEDKVVVLTHRNVTVLTPETGVPKWETRCGEIASTPVYYDKTLFIATTGKIVALDFETGKIKWQTPIPGETSVFWIYPFELLLYKDMLFAGVKGPGVYCLNTQSGDILWEYNGNRNNDADLYLVEDRLLVKGGGVLSFNAKTGEKIWEMPGYLHVEIYKDRTLVKTLESGGFYWSLVHTGTGQVLWKKQDTVKYPQYYNNMLYFANSLQKRIVCMDTQCMEEVWSRFYDNNIGGIKIIDNYITFFEYIENGYKEFVTRIVFMDLNGNIIWQHTYKEGDLKWSSHILNIFLYGDTLFFVRGGSIEAVTKDTGIPLWKTEVRGSYISSFDIHKNTIYVTSDDSRLYCINVGTGTIQWFYELEKELRYFDWSNVLHPEFNNNFIAVATREGGIFLFSHYVKRGPRIE